LCADFAISRDELNHSRSFCHGNIKKIGRTQEGEKQRFAIPKISREVGVGPEVGDSWLEQEIRIRA